MSMSSMDAWYRVMKCLKLHLTLLPEPCLYLPLASRFGLHVHPSPGLVGVLVCTDVRPSLPLGSWPAAHNGWLYSSSPKPSPNLHIFFSTLQ